MRLINNKKKQCHFFFLFFLLFFLPLKAFSLEKLSIAESKNVTAQSGLSMAADDVILYFGSDSVSIESKNNRSLFDNVVNSDIDEGYLAFNNTSGILTLDNTMFTLDIGTYYRPNETYRVADIYKDGNSLKWLESGRNYLGTGTGSSSPKYWTIPNPNGSNYRSEPMDAQYGVIQAEINDLFDTFDLTTTLGFYGGVGSEETLSMLNISGLHMPPLTVGGVDMPGAKLTLYPDDKANINFELRTRLTIDEIKMSNPASPGSLDLKISGIHIGEAFYNQWNQNPLHTNAGDSGDISGFSTDFHNFMYSGYFLFGNLNQVNFTDYLKKNVGGATYKDGRQIYNLTTIVHADPDGNPYHDGTTFEFEPLWIKPNPISINIGMRDDPDNLWDGYSYFSISGGLHGSIRVESVQGQGKEMGPIAIDGIRVKHLEIEFPGGRTRDHYDYSVSTSPAYLGTSARGLVWEGQLDYLNTLTLNQWKP